MNSFLVVFRVSIYKYNSAPSHTLYSLAELCIDFSRFFSFHFCPVIFIRAFGKDYCDSEKPYESFWVGYLTEHQPMYLGFTAAEDHGWCMVYVQAKHSHPANLADQRHLPPHATGFPQVTIRYMRVQTYSQSL